jgi:hypothetical protein
MKPWTILTVLMLLVAAGCAALPSEPGRGAAEEIAVEGAFARPSPSEGGTGGAFMTITNNTGAAIRLASASSPAAKMVEIHETIDDNGVMKMRPVAGGIAIPPGKSVELKPGGMHIMLMDLTSPLVAGQEVELTLNFDKAGPVTVKVPVKLQ